MKNGLKLLILLPAVASLFGCPPDAISEHYSNSSSTTVQMPLSVGGWARGDCNNALDGGACTACYVQSKGYFDASYDISNVTKATTDLSNSMKSAASSSFGAKVEAAGPVGGGIKAKADSEFDTKSSTEAANVAKAASDAAASEAAKLKTQLVLNPPCARRIEEWIHGHLNIVITANLTINVSGTTDNPVTAVTYTMSINTTFSVDDTDSKTTNLVCNCGKKDIGDVGNPHLPRPTVTEPPKRTETPKDEHSLRLDPSDLGTNVKVYVKADPAGLETMTGVMVLEKTSNAANVLVPAIGIGAAAGGAAIYTILQKSPHPATPNLVNDPGVAKKVGDTMAYQVPDMNPDSVYRAVGKDGGGNLVQVEGTKLGKLDGKDLLAFDTKGSDLKTVEYVEKVDGKTGETISKSPTATYSDKLVLNREAYQSGEIASGRYTIESSGALKDAEFDVTFSVDGAPAATQRLKPGTYPLESFKLVLPEAGQHALSATAVPVQ